MSKTKKTKLVSLFWENLKDFINRTEGLDKSLLSMVLISDILKKEDKKLNSFIEEKGLEIKKEKDKIYYYVSPKDQEFHNNLRKALENSKIAYKILPQSVFVGLVSQFDIFFASIVKLLLNEESNIISPEKTLSFKEIKKFKTIKDVIDHLIEKEIDALLFESHSAHLEWITKKTGIDLKKYFEKELPTFIELTERRNLFVHSDGIVNEHYLTKCKQVGITLPNNYKRGTILNVSPVYFKNSSECLYKISFKLTYLLWKKFIPRDQKEADILFNNEITIDLIKNKKYVLAEELLEFAVKYFTDSEEEIKKLFLINLALTKKLDGRKKEAVALIDSQDWTACNNDIKLAISVLKDDFDDAYMLMKKIGKEGELISEEIYMTMPIFDSIRKQKKFADMFRKIYKKELNSSEEKQEIITMGSTQDTSQINKK